MRTLMTRLATVALLLVVAAPVGAQTPPGAHRMEIQNGGRINVRYFTGRMSPGEAGAVRDLERAENDAMLVAELRDLRRQYVSDERTMQAVRTQIQQELYGFNSSSTLLAGTTGTFGGIPAGLAGLSGAFGTGAFGTGGLFGAGFGLPGGRGLVGETAVSRSLAFGMGDEGVIKSALAGVLRDQSRPEFAQATERDLVSASQSLVRMARGPAARPGDGAIRPAVGEVKPGAIRPAIGEIDTGKVTVLLKDGERLTGTRVEEDKTWVTVYTTSGRVRIRPDEVSRIYDNGPGAGTPMPRAGE